MNELSGREVGRRILDAVRTYIARVTAQFEAKLKQIEDGLEKLQVKSHFNALPGPKGEKGDRGEKGEPGDRGMDGAHGLQGEKGEKGDKGDRGLDGERGAAGERGPAGEPGAKGEKGDKGEQGPQGIKGEKGDKGDPGEPGQAGKDGALGATGEQGEPGAKGDPGRDGRDGRDGKDGEPGRDALEMDLVPEINLERSYPRGTWGRGNNGIWRAARTTKGMDGWECIVPGIAGVKTERDGRKFSIITELSDGKKFVNEFKLDYLDDKGVWRPDGKYEKGDGVSFGGSFFIAQVDNPTDKPETSDQWRLAVKHGRDLRDKDRK